MPPRVTYWTGIWEPHREATSNEVQTLRRALQPDAPVVSFSSGQVSVPAIRDRVVRLSAGRWLILRGLAAALERTGDVTHAVGPIDSWHLLRALGRRPLLFTVVSSGARLERRLFDKVARFAVESESLRDELRAAGVAEHRISVVYPGVDLTRFRPSPSPEGRFRVLFASTPAQPAEFEARGIHLLIDTARARPDVDFVLRWRNWGNRAAAAARFRALDPPQNVLVEPEANDMAVVYRGAHATVCCFAAGFGKAVPNSVIEGLASGRPTLVANTCGIARVIARSGGGVAVERSVAGLAGGIDVITADLAGYARRARTLAEDLFGHRAFESRYRELYQELAS